MVAIRLPTSTVAVGPKKTPFGLTRKILPLAVSDPNMADGSPPVILFSVTELLSGCAKCTCSLAAILN